MIAIDTNILLRIFEIEDDPEQSSRAREAIEDNAPVYLHDVVLAEFVWTCRRTFRQSRQAIYRRLKAIAESTEFVVARPKVFERAVEAMGHRNRTLPTGSWVCPISNRVSNTP